MRRERTELDPAAIPAVDPGGMLASIASLGRQLREGFGTAASTRLPAAGVNAVVLCGMGGSGIAGDILRALFAPRLPVPVVVVKGYALPSFCGPQTLVIASSYSGSTEETLAAYAQAVSRGCRVVTVSSGGDLADLSSADAVPRVRVPPGLPPRAALGYLAAAPVGVLQASGLAPAASAEVEEAAQALERLAEELGPSTPSGENEAKGLAEWLLGRVPIVWGSEGLAEAAAARWKTQLNENAKVPAFDHELPELDHNEIVGWEGVGDLGPFSLVLLDDADLHPRVRHRIELTQWAVDPMAHKTFRIETQGRNAVERVFSLVLLGDLVSLYMAVLRGVDPGSVRALDVVKERLSAARA